MAIFALVFGPFASVQFASAGTAVLPSGVLNKNTQVDLCHKNQGESVYSLVQSKAEAIVLQSNSGHPVGSDDAGKTHPYDIIPPFDYDFDEGTKHFDGRNWSSGEEIFLNNCTIPSIEPTVDLSIVKAVSNSTPNEGTNVTYTLTVTNAGPSTATNVVVTDTLPPGVSFVSSVPTGGSPWNLSPIPSGGSSVITIVVATALVDADTLVTNTASVDGTETDIDSTNNTDSVSMTVKDVPPPPNPGTIIVDKVTVPTGDTQSFTFVTTGTNYNGFSLTDTAAPNSQQLAAGTYSVIEDVVTGWTPTSAECVSSIQDVETPGALELDENETITCTFTNTRDTGSLTILKDTNDVLGDSVQFDFSGTGAIGTFDVLGNSIDSQVFSSLPTGSYTITELNEADWTFGSVTCNEGASWDNTTNGVVVNLGKADDVTCTFVNIKDLVDDTTITINKVTSETSDAVFGFFLDDSSEASASLQGGQSSGAIAVTPGSHNIVEGVAAGWTLDQNNSSCVNEAQQVVGSFDGSPYYLTLAEGDDIVCTFTNTKDVPPAPVCTYLPEYPNNLLENGSFEEPIVTANGGTWEIFSSVTDWIISLSDGLELWKGLGIGASDGEQNAELDGNDATKITQTVATIAGATYQLRFDFAARTTDAADNHIEAAVDGVSLINQSTANTEWVTYSKTFVADSSSDISFEDLGKPQDGGGTGTLLDNAVLCLVEEPEREILGCTDPEANNYDPEAIIDNQSCTYGGGGGGGGGGSSSPRCDAFDLNDDVLSWETSKGYDLEITQNGEEIFSTTDDDEVDEGTYILKPSELSVAGDEFVLTVNRGSKDDTCTINEGEVLGDSTQKGEVLGDATSTLPVGAPNTGAGGTSPVAPVLPSFLAILAEGTGTRRVR